MNIQKNLTSKIPKEVSHVTNTLESAGFETYLAGGCVRDLLMSQIFSETEGNRIPKDWDITTNARPEQIISLFEKTVYENTFGTVGVCVPFEVVAKKDVPRETAEDDVTHETKENGVIRETHEDGVTCGLPTQAGTPKYEIVEVTTYRTEAKYSDFRHPDEVQFSDKLEDDLKRRDFTVNAMAYSISKGQLVDMFDGLKDIKDKTLKAVGNPDDRFTEDALRMLRAIRFAVQLDFSISSETSESIFKNSGLIKNISSERIRDEFIKIIMSKNPSIGIVMLQKFNLLKYIIPELEDGINCEQGGEHIYDVWNHLLHALQHAADKNWPLEIRLSALFHDIGKPKSRRSAVGGFKKPEINLSGPRFSSPSNSPLEIEARPDHAKLFSDFSNPKKQFTFYGHEVVSEKMARKILERLKFSKKEIDLVDKLVRNHMFFSDTELITLSAVRRIIVKVGAENIWALMNVRECDRVGMKKKEAPYRLRKYFAMIEEALHDPISVGQLKINGEDLIKDIGIKPGPRMGWILNALLEEVLDDSSKNTKEHLTELVKAMDLLPDNALRTLGERGKEKKDKLEEEEVSKLHKRHGV